MSVFLHTASRTATPEAIQPLAEKALGDGIEITVLMPCLNEVETVASCVSKAMAFLQRAGISGEVLVADNGSTDGSVQAAISKGARVVAVPERGYGNAIRRGIEIARGRFVIVGDSDDSYDFSRLDSFVARLRSGDQLVLGNRFAGGIAPGAMPLLHRYLGNPVLSFIGRLFFRAPISDFHCGLRGLDRGSIMSLGLGSTGMEYASEMIVKATLARLKVVEVPTKLSRDGRSRPPHLRSWRDGWRHLRFLLMMSPRWLLFYPGVALILVGLLAQAIIVRGPVVIHSVGFDIHTMLYSAGATILGLQLVIFSLIARAIGHTRGLLPATPGTERIWRIVSLERGIVLGVVIGAGGLAVAVHSVAIWLDAHLGALDPTAMMRYAIPSVTMMISGAEIVFASFVLNLIEPNGKRMLEA